ncbi:hypothetical protein [Halovenus salina]|uniref:Uncharacterized protein n=1 Tax=Halovenus salina TaxID=1510225 RepID=A0ABD5W378_9EURY|nr:hypothetical protein [Halovenus salina]
MVNPLRWLSGLIGSAGDSSETEATDEENQFVPSEMDASVLQAHGMETASAEQELTQMEEQADELESQHRENR